MSGDGGRRNAGPGPTSFECPHYDPKPGTKKCRDYVHGGACARPDQLMCVEWLKVNSPNAAAGLSAPTHEASISEPDLQAQSGADAFDLFGTRVETAAPPPCSDHEPQPQPDLSDNDGCDRPVAPQAPTGVAEVPLVRTLSDREVGGLAEVGVEVCMESDAVASFWLVPELTDSDRHELTFQHGATLAAICAAFPGTKVTSMKWAPRKAAGERSSKDDGNASAAKGAAR